MQGRHGQGCKERQQPPGLLFSNSFPQRTLPWKELDSDSPILFPHLPYCFRDSKARKTSLSTYSQESGRALTRTGFALPSLGKVRLQQEPLQVDYPKMFLDILIILCALLSLKIHIWGGEKNCNTRLTSLIFIKHKHYAWGPFEYS